MAKRYRRKYYNDYVDAIGLLIVCIICAIVSFILKYWKLILIILLIVISIFFLIKYRKNIKNKIIELKNNIYLSKLKKKTVLYPKILLLNSQYNLPTLEPLKYKYPVKNKSDLQTSNMDDYLLKTFQDNYDDIMEYENKYSNYLANYVSYNKQYEELKKYVNEDEAKKIKMSPSKYFKYQHILLEYNKQKKYYDFKIIIELVYKSKMGRIYKTRKEEFGKEETDQIYNKYLELKNSKELYKISAYIERAKINDSIRYDVLKRDNYKCCICGRTKDDGVILEVDHIIPVSKGGKSTMDNLQTLCDRCNGGKSNKI